MKAATLLAAAFVVAFSPLAAQQPADAKRDPAKISLVGGDTITGTVSGVKDGNVSVITDYGVIRVPVLKLTEDSRKKLGILADANVAQLEKRIAELEALVERLRAENAQLRRQPAPTPTQVQPLTGGGGTNKVTASLRRLAAIGSARPASAITRGAGSMLPARADQARQPKAWLAKCAADETAAGVRSTPMVV